MASTQSFSASASVSRQATSYGYTNFDLSSVFPNNTAKPIKADFYVHVHRDWYLFGSPTATAYIDYNGVSKCEISSNREDGTSKTEAGDTATEVTGRGKSDTTARIGVKSSNSGCTARAEGTITLYFTRYDFSASAGAGIASATVSRANGYDGDTVTFTATPSAGYTFTQWSDGSTQNPHTITVNGADISLTAYASAPIDNLATYSIAYGGIIRSTFATTVPCDVTYRGNRITQVGARMTKILPCANKLFTGNITCGTKSLTTNAKVASSDIMISSTIPAPQGYTELSSIRSTGGAYLDTGIRGVDGATYRIIYDGKYDTSQPNNRGLQGFGGSASEYWGVQGGKYETSTVVTSVSAGNRDKIVWEYTAGGKQRLYVNGNLISEKATSTISGKPLQLFAINGGYLMAGTLYYCTVYKDGVIVADLYPYRRNSDGVIGMIDFVSKSFIVPNGTMTGGQYNILSGASWSLSNVTYQDGIFTFASGGLAMAQVSLTKPIANHLYYGSVEERKMPECTSIADGRFEYFAGDGTNKNMIFSSLVDQPNDGQWYKDSRILSMDAPIDGNWVMRNFTVSANGACYRRNPKLVDLTAEFGAGNEPSLAWCDANL